MQEALPPVEEAIEEAVAPTAHWQDLFACEMEGMDEQVSTTGGRVSERESASECRVAQRASE